MTFDPTVTVGNVLTMLVIVGGGLAAYASLVARLAVIETKVNLLWERSGAPSSRLDRR